MSEQQDAEEWVADIFEDSGFEVVWTKDKGFKNGEGKTLFQIDVIAFYKKICILIEVTTGGPRSLSSKISRFKDNCNLLIEDHDINEYLNQLEDGGIKIPSEVPVHSDLKFKKLLVASEFEGSTIPSSRLGDIKLWDKEILTYFDIVSDTINKYTRYDLFSFFGVTPNDLEGHEDAIQPRESTALRFSIDGEEVISFIASPQEMLKMARVLRRDSHNPDSYQRLIDKNRLLKIRDFILDKGGYFPNNVLVSMSNPPTDFKLFISNKIHFLEDFEQYYIIDGQHRLFAFALDNTAEHYKKYTFSDNPTEKQKKKYEQLKEKDEKLRKLLDKKCLIISVLNFRNLTRKQRLKSEAQTFVDINFNQVKVKTELIYDIAWDILESRMPEAFATVIVKRLNNENIFKGMFRRRSYEKNKLSFVSFVKFGLKYLVDSDQKNEGELYKYASDEVKEEYGKNNFEPFISHCVKILKDYFEVIKEVYCECDEMWNPEHLDDYKLLSSTSLTGFVRLLRQFLVFYEGKINKKKIKDILSKVDYDFTSGWKHTSPSQWSQFEWDFVSKIKNYKDKLGNKPFSNFAD